MPPPVVLKLTGGMSFEQARRRLIATHAASGRAKPQIGCKRDRLDDSSASSLGNFPKRSTTGTLEIPQWDQAQYRGIGASYMKVAELTTTGFIPVNYAKTSWKDDQLRAIKSALLDRIRRHHK
uniref:Uncharacterized protein n=1 Tax=Glossina austeni TaxID=7395 RepID=A0A1A9VFQ9_GLOAU